MNWDQFKEQIIKNLKYLHNFNLEKFLIYKDFLQQENLVHNLSNICDDEKIFGEYFFDSMIPFHELDLNNKKLLDIGSGSGIPGIALKIIFPELKLTIIESNKKKINFMNSLAKKLGFDDIIFINKRAEEISNEHIEAFDIVTSRAVANLGILIEISSQYVKIGGLLIEPKSNNFMNEFKPIENKISEFGLALKKIDSIKSNGKAINTFIFEKNSKCNNKYPRKWKEIINQWK